MTELVFIKDGTQVGYVDTEAAEGGYIGDDPFIKGLVNDQIGKSLGGPRDQLNGPTQYLEGERLEEYLRGLPDDHPEVDFEIKERSEVDFEVDQVES
jgi:hypothetical protein